MNKAACVAVALCAVLWVGCSGSDDKGKDIKTGTHGIKAPVVSAEDRSRCDVKGKRVIKLDLNRDKQPDVWKLYATKIESGAKVEMMTCKEIDLNFDGRKDIWIYYDKTGSRKMEEMDLDFDGHIDITTIRRANKIVRQDLDTNFDSKPDIWKYFEAEVLVRLDRDSNADGKVDYWEYYEGGRLDRVGYDKDGDGRVDTWDRAPAEASVSPTAATKPTPTPAPKTKAAPTPSK